MTFEMLKRLIKALEDEGTRDEAIVGALDESNPVPLSVYAVTLENHPDTNGAQTVWIKVTES
jgi:hypothetical protein